MELHKETAILNMLEVLGGTRRLSLMINAKNFVKGEDEDGNPFIMFSHMKSEMNKANKFKMIYDEGSDLFIMEFWRVWGSKATLIKRIDGVYVDMVRGLFREETGLALEI